MTLGSMFPDATTAEDEWADYGDHAAHLRVLRQNLAKL